VSAVKTTNAVLMRWGVSLIHNYLQFALKWAQGGEDEVVYKVGDGLERKSIGRNWSSMTMTLWSASASATEYISLKYTSVVARDELTTVWREKSTTKT
ncbi:hypothetical protein BKA70DRAFT_1099230, partial [Coprinopsis sp. MPI-PUGE-AT-0042]